MFFECYNKYHVEPLSTDLTPSCFRMMTEAYSVRSDSGSVSSITETHSSPWKEVKLSHNLELRLRVFIEEDNSMKYFKYPNIFRFQNPELNLNISSFRQSEILQNCDGPTCDKERLRLIYVVYKNIKMSLVCLIPTYISTFDLIELLQFQN